MTGILFVARLGSTRLQQKHLIKAGQKTFIEWLVARYANEFKKEIENGEIKLIIATSNRPENKTFESVLNGLPVNVFYGSDENIPLRQFECSEKYALKNIISIDGDDILCSTSAARLVFEAFDKKSQIFVKSSGLPFGMNCLGYSSLFLKNAVMLMKTDKAETGWGRIFENKPVLDITINKHTNDKRLRFTLDYALDADFFKAVIDHFGERTLSVTDDELITTVIKKQLFLINASLHDEYWDNFNKSRNTETQTRKE